MQYMYLYYSSTVISLLCIYYKLFAVFFWGKLIAHSGKKKLNEPRECLFKWVQSKVLVEK